MRVFDVLGWILIINGFHGLGVFIKRHLKGDLFNIIINIVIGFFIIIYTTIPIRLLFAIFALYITLNGVVKFITYLNYKRDKVDRRFPVLCGAIFLIIYGLALFLGRYVDVNVMMIFIGVYGLFLGINYVIDGVFTVVPQQHKDSLKRRIRIPVPIFISAIIPKVMMDYINERLAVEPKEKFLDDRDHANVEILYMLVQMGLEQSGIVIFVLIIMLFHMVIMTMIQLDCVNQLVMVSSLLLQEKAIFLFV